VKKLIFNVDCKKKTHTSSEAQKSGEKLISEVRQKKCEKTHTSSEAKQNGEKLISEVRHKKVKKDAYLK
jgi:cytochrome c peroxidase